ncbi:MAG TPA: hypothetical protein VER03_20040, partial [Bryobacteraceae bacterium]|nr:hypothetical protein [Bryobacteraceae bacterium]
MRVVRSMVLTGAALALAVAAQAEVKKFEFAVIGDAPYGPAGGTPRVQIYPSAPYERMIADINESLKDNKSFVIHVGDIKEGNSLCSNEVYAKNLEYFNTFDMAAVFVPGDNEWTDCHRTTNGSFDPLERLSLLRQTFYPNNETLGKRTLTVTRQSGYPENSRWQYGQVLFVTLNMPGSNNGFQNANSAAGVPNIYRAAMDAEYAARNAANVAWLNAAFDVAQNDSKIKGVFISIQANVFERFLEGGQGYTISGYSDFVTALRSRTVALDRPVVLAHGDTHYYRLDRPMTGTYPACANGVQSPCVAVAVPGSPTDRT